jgi:poly(3-hydroxybutyrate) depolymerase
VGEEGGVSNRSGACMIAVVGSLIAVALACASGSDTGRVPTRRAVRDPVDGTERFYLLDVPATATDGHPAPLVVDLHGLSEGAELHRRSSGFAALGERKGFVTATPMGQGTAASTFFDARPGSADVAFVRAVLDQVEATRCIDPRRVDAADTTLIGYRCPKGSDVELYRITDGDHTWPGSATTAQLSSVLGKTTLSIDATALMWDFFSAHALPSS